MAPRGGVHDISQVQHEVLEARREVSEMHGELLQAKRDAAEAKREAGRARQEAGGVSTRGQEGEQRAEELARAVQERGQQLGALEGALQKAQEGTAQSIAEVWQAMGELVVPRPICLIRSTTPPKYQVQLSYLVLPLQKRLTSKHLCENDTDRPQVNCGTIIFRPKK